MIEYFIKNGMLTPNEAALAINLHKNSGTSLESAIIELGLLQEDKVITYCRKILDN